MRRCCRLCGNDREAAVYLFLAQATSTSVFEDVSISQVTVEHLLTATLDLTKYDCSSADLNPIGSISKTDLKSFIAWASNSFDMPILEEFIHAVPTAELEPITENYVQSDEGMSVSFPKRH